MDNYLVNQDSLIKLSQCFSAEELETFINDLSNLTEEIAFTSILMKRVDDENAANLLLKQLCIVTIFFRENVELLHEMIKSLEYRPLTEEEIKKLKG